MALFPPEFSWARFLACARALLAAVGLLSALVGRPQTSTYYYVVLSVYLMAALVMVFRVLPGGTVSLLALFGDIVYFLILAAAASERSLWLVSVYFLYVMVEALVLHHPREVALGAASAALFCAVMPGPAMGPLARTVVVSGVLAYSASVLRKRCSAQLEDAQTQVEAVRAAGVQAVDNERSRIASDFHDGPLQNFISMQMRLDILRKLLERDPASGMEELREMQTLAQKQVRELRAFLNSMRPVDVDGRNVVAGIRRAAESFQKESGIPVTFVGADQQANLAPDVGQEVLLMVREGLHNIHKHAGATRVAVAVERTEKGLEIAIDDNGHGFSFVGAYTLEELDLLKIGPASLKRRARSVNAGMTLESRPGRGAGIKLRIPLP